MDHIPPLVEVIQTCQACPSQWSAWDADGNWYYLRYRSGRGTVEFVAGGPPPGADPDAFVDALGTAALLTDFVYGGQYDGEITLDEFLHLADMRTAA